MDSSNSGMLKLKRFDIGLQTIGKQESSHIASHNKIIITNCIIEDKN